MLTTLLMSRKKAYQLMQDGVRQNPGNTLSHVKRGLQEDRTKKSLTFGTPTIKIFNQ